MEEDYAGEEDEEDKDREEWCVAFREEMKQVLGGQETLQNRRATAHVIRETGRRVLVCIWEEYQTRRLGGVMKMCSAEKRVG